MTTFQMTQPKELTSRDRTWEKDDARTTCSLCGDLFNVINRKHHCRLCGSLICASCSAFMSFDHRSTSLLTRAKRVCRDCSDLYQHTPHHHSPIASHSQTIPHKSSSVRVYENNHWEPRFLELRGDELQVSASNKGSPAISSCQHRVVNISGSELRTHLTNEKIIIESEKCARGAHFFAVLPCDSSPPLFVAVDTNSELNDWVLHICEASNDICQGFPT
eukprot:c21091_g1_i1.p1 GENE.c21091_g1_i1~~c21091_g1_i1.p1  ORF type:complete len:219 (-),score=31.52 c21091_g1_i1:119-775(-)